MLREGFARDIIRNVQQQRKDSGLEIQNHIKMRWFAEDENIVTAMAEHGEYICSETLCDGIGRAESAIDDGNEVKLGTAALCFEIEKV